MELSVESLISHESLINNHIKNIRKDFGIFFTPERVVDFMVKLIDYENFAKEDIKILEPACGLMQFLFGIKRNAHELFRNAEIFGVEINEDIVNYANDLNKENNIKIINDDYLLWQTSQKYGIIIGNPPYGIPSTSEHYTIKVEDEIKQEYKKIYETWHGKYNVYGAFIEKSIKLLKNDGQLIFIVPATFMILDEFKKLRKFLAKNGKTTLIYMGIDIFKPEAEISSVVLNFKKSSHNFLELSEYKNNSINILKESDNWHGEVVKFETEFTKKLKEICSHNLSNIYDIRISPRTPEIKNSNIITKENKNENYLPVLNGRNLKCFKISYENMTNYWIKKEDIKKLRKYFSYQHLVVGLGFREDGKVASAYDEKCYAWMGDVYHLLRKNTLSNMEYDLNDYEVMEYLNSDFIKRYVKDTYREITYHLSITQIKELPLPMKDELKRIKEELHGSGLAI